MGAKEEKEKALLRLEEAKKALKAANINEKKERRNREARGKILVGGYVLACVKAGDSTMKALIDKMIENTSREDDREAIKLALETTKAKSADQAPPPALGGDVAPVVSVGSEFSGGGVGPGELGAGDGQARESVS